MITYFFWTVNKKLSPIGKSKNIKVLKIRLEVFILGILEDLLNNFSVFEKFLRPAESVRFIVKDENFSKTIAKDCQVSKEEKIFGTHLSQSSEVQA